MVWLWKRISGRYWGYQGGGPLLNTAVRASNAAEFPPNLIYRSTVTGIDQLDGTRSDDNVAVLVDRI
jgi:hypothetical protein